LRRGAQTEVFVPRLHYPHGYRVQVTGAHVTSAAGAQLLRLATDAGAGQVSVRVSPA
jgi:endoglycosylceramidase